MEVGEGVDSLLLEGAVKVLVRQHDALRLCFEQRGGEWMQEYGQRGVEGVYHRVDLSGVAKGERVRAMEEDADGRQASLRLSEGRMMLAVEYDLGDEGRRLVLVVHHLAVDGVSWRILLEDLRRGLRAIREGRGGGAWGKDQLVPPVGREA